MKEITFEEALSQLEAIVKKLEQSPTSLQDGLKLFDEGSGLILRLRKELEKAEQKVEFISKKLNNSTEEPGDQA
jgi:exodeoxyribonuclease VII small subunit